MKPYQITFKINKRPLCWIRYNKNINEAKRSAKKAIKNEYNQRPNNLLVKELADYSEYNKNDVILQLGEFQLMKYSDNSFLIKKDNGEAMEVNINTLKEIWKKYN